MASWEIIHDITHRANLNHKQYNNVNLTTIHIHTQCDGSTWWRTDRAINFADEYPK